MQFWVFRSSSKQTKVFGQFQLLIEVITQVNEIGQRPYWSNSVTYGHRTEIPVPCWLLAKGLSFSNLRLSIFLLTWPSSIFRQAMAHRLFMLWLQLPFLSFSSAFKDTCGLHWTHMEIQGSLPILKQLISNLNYLCKVTFAM